MDALSQTSNAGQMVGQPDAPVALVAPLIPTARKISPNREPVREHSPRRFVLAELLVGTGIAVIMYLILSRPVDPPAASAAAASDTSEAAQIAPPPAGAYRPFSPVDSATISGAASLSERVNSISVASSPSQRPIDPGTAQTDPVTQSGAKAARRTSTPSPEHRSHLAADKQ